MELIQTIRNEIDRLYDGEAPKHDQQCDFDDGYFTGIGAISKFLDTLQEQSVKDDEIDFEQELYNHFGQVKDFTLGMRIAQYFYNLGKNAKK